MMKTRVFGAIFIALLTIVVLLTTCGLKIKEVQPDRDGGGQESCRCVFTSPPMPDSLSFMQEVVPLDRFEVYENLEREILVNANFHSQTIRLIKLAPRYFSIIDPILESEGVPSDFRYLAVAESNLNPKAYSPSGAAGIWQFMKGTAAEYGLEVNVEVDERYHIEKATRAACKYLKEGYLKYGSWSLVAAAYNAGHGAIEKQMERQGACNYYDLLLAEETERYVFRILSLKLILEDPARYGFQIAEKEKYPLLKTRKVEVTGPISDWAAFAREYGITYKTLKYYNPWLRETVLANKNGKSYFIEIPR